MPTNGQIHVKNVAAFAAIFLTCLAILRIIVFVKYLYY